MGCRIENYAEKKKTILIDADACPFKEDIVKLATRFNIGCIFVTSYAHVPRDQLGSTWVFVDCEKEAVDLYIINHAKREDIVITQDLGLASLLLKKGIIVVHPRGNQLKEEDMDLTLHIRWHNRKLLNSRQRVKGPKRLSEADRDRLMQTLEKNLSNLAGIQGVDDE